MDRLLHLLNQNARLTNTQLASMLGLSVDEVEKKIGQLEKEGIIRGYKPIVNWEKAGNDYVTALIELRVVPKRDLGFDEIAGLIMNLDEVESVYLMSGGYDLAVIVSAKSFQDVAIFVAKRLSPLESVLSTATHFILSRYKEMGIQMREDPVDERRMTEL